MWDRIRSNIKKIAETAIRLSARVDFQFVPIISFETKYTPWVQEMRSSTRKKSIIMAYDNKVETSYYQLCST